MYETWKAVHGALTALTEVVVVEEVPVVQNDPPPPEFDFSSLEIPPPAEDQMVVLQSDENTDPVQPTWFNPPTTPARPGSIRVVAMPARSEMTGRPVGLLASGA